MGYVVRKLSGKRPFKVQYASYVGGKQSVRDIPETEWARLGFTRRMSLEEAQARRDGLNAQGALKRIEAKRAVIRDKLKEEELTHEAYLNPLDMDEFERQVLVLDSKSKLASHWRAAKRIITEFRIPPKEWSEKRRMFYDFFTRHSLSTSYMQKIIRVLNLWGKWQAKKYETFYEEIVFPRGHELQKVADKFFEQGETKESAPLKPEALESVRSELREEHYNWLYLTVWLGLRPIEADLLHSSKNYRIEEVRGVAVIAVYQSKLTSVPREKRWKHIPLIFKEQKRCLAIIESGIFKRPLVKTIKDRLGEDIGAYGGRKGFTDLMLDKGQKFENIAAWLGHSNLNRTWKSYKDRQKVAFD